MITPWKLYWMTRLDDIGITLGIVAGIFAISAVVEIVKFIDDKMLGSYCDGEDADKRKKPTLWLLLIATALLFVNAFIPSTRQMAAIWVIPKVANSETVAELGVDVKCLAQEWLRSLRPSQPDKSPDKEAAK